MKKQKKSLLFVLFALYILILFRITVFRSDFLTHGLFSGSILWVPFVELYRILRNDFFVFFYLFVGNIIWFIPFGFLLPGLWNTGKKAILYTLLLSLVIELLQFVFGTGVTEVEDLILNTLGGAMGYWAFIFIKSFSANPHNENEPLP